MKKAFANELYLAPEIRLDLRSVAISLNPTSRYCCSVYPLSCNRECECFPHGCDPVPVLVHRFIVQCFFGQAFGSIRRCCRSRPGQQRADGQLPHQCASCRDRIRQDRVYQFLRGIPNFRFIRRDVTLEVFYTGLDTSRVSVTLSAGQASSQNFVLTNRQLSGDDETVTLDAFLVQATEQANDAVAINEQRFSSNIKNVISADAFGDVTEGNPGEFLKYLPGVSVDYVAADVRSISVRGFGSKFTSVNVDGNRMASSASSGDSRSFELEQVSMNNVARLEVVKVPLPSMPADSLGGSVNMISKNAFERDNAEFKYRIYTSISDENLSFGKSPGPGVEMVGLPKLVHLNS